MTSSNSTASTKKVRDLEMGDWIIGPGGSMLLVKSASRSPSASNARGRWSWIIETDIGTLLLDGDKEFQVSRDRQVWVMFHTFDTGHQIEVYATQQHAQEHGAQIALDYCTDIKETDDDPVNEARAAFKRGEYAECLRIIIDEALPSMDGCNIEVMEVPYQTK